MKKFLFSAAAGLLCFFISCTDSSTKTTSDTQSEKNTMHNREVYRAMETGDVSKLDSFIDKDIVDHTDRGDVKGIDTLKKMFTQMHNGVKDLKMDIISEASNDDYHFAWFHMTGTTADASMGMPAGTNMDMNGIDVVKIKDGKAVEHWAFADPKEMMKMMGGGNHDMDHGNMNDGKMDSSKMSK